MSVAAEQAVIGACLTDSDSYWKVSGILKVEDFCDSFTRKCFKAISELMEESGPEFIDVLVMAETYDLDLPKLTEFAFETPSAKNIGQYAKRVIDASLARTANTIMVDALGDLRNGNLSAIAEVQEKLEALSRNDDNSTKDWSAVLRSGLDHVEIAREIAREGGGLLGAPTGVSAIDERSSGLHGGKLIVWAARPGLGKTALALQAAQAAAEAGFPVGFVSLEMSSEEIGIRAFAHKYKVNNTALDAGDLDAIAELSERLTSDEAKRERFKHLPIYLEEDAFAVDEIIARTTSWSRKHDIKLLFVDHLQMMDVPVEMTRNDALGMITRRLKKLAKRLGFPIVLLSQLNRDLEKTDRYPRMSDLRDSGNIEQDADVIMFLHGKVDVNVHGVRDMELIFAKMRGGVPGYGGSIRFNGRTQTFSAIDNAVDWQDSFDAS